MNFLLDVIFQVISSTLTNLFSIFLQSLFGLKG